LTTVMVTGVDGGAAQSVVKCLRLAGKYRIVVVGIDPYCIGVHVGDVGYVVSRDWEIYKQQIHEICRREGVDIIIPGSDIELDHFSENIDWYREHCAPVIVDPETVKTARDKYLTSITLKELGFKSPKTWTVEEFKSIDSYPVVLKPRKGYGSNMLFKDVEEEEIFTLSSYIIRHGWEPIAQEQIEGKEYSCMTLRSREGELLATEVAWSYKKYGQSYKTIVLKGKEDMEDYVERVSEALRSKGPLSLQLIEREGEYYIFELNARFTGAQIVRAHAGQNGPDLLVQNWLYGTKKYPKVERDLVALWYHDFGYLSPRDLERVLREGRTNMRRVRLPKLL